MDEDRNDSGFHSSSPGSENSVDGKNFTQFAANVPVRYEVNPFQVKQEIPSEASATTASKFQFEHDGFANNRQENNFELNNPLQRLQASLDKNNFSPNMSPRSSEHSGDDDKKSDYENKEYDETDTPRVNSHGKIKTFKCKYCNYIGITKHAYWEHLKIHIKEDKRLSCQACGFITEYKHHLEYHMRNHDGSKPFKCTKCSYSCVNKSMLSSHMKSHSNIYQYRCANCSYATKYCHSLKLHLRKYDHKPDIVLNADGTPNPLPIIDVYGTRRGPKQKSSVPSEQQSSIPNSAWQNPLAQLMMNPMQLPFPYHLLANLPNDPNKGFLPSIIESLNKQLENTLHQDQRRDEIIEEETSTIDSHDESQQEQDEEQQQQQQVVESLPDEQAGVLDLSVTSKPIKTHRRKGPAYKLKDLRFNNESSGEESENSEASEKTLISTTPPPPPAKVEEEIIEKNNNENSKENNNYESEKSYSCQYCNINFGDMAMYTMHMGYHGFKDPYTCNMCGEHCKDRLAFYLHIIRDAHK